VNFDLLRTFVVAADALNFTKAADTLHLTQPAVSQHVKELEGHFKQPLFERRGRQVTLSPAGRALLPIARELLARWADARESLGQLNGQVGGELALGAGNTAGVYLLPRVLGRFRAAHPHVRVSLKVGPTRDLLDMLGHGALDLALMEDATADEAKRPVERVPFLTDELVLIAPPAGPLGPLQAIDLAELPLLSRSATSATERPIRAALAAAGLASDRLKIALELGSTEAIKQGVMAGLGLGFVSRFAIRDEVATGRLRIVPIEGVHVERQLWLVAPVRHVQPAAVQLFQAFLLADPGASG
jgi:DNA-binding transcriptional LysR family regulator